MTKYNITQPKKAEAAYRNLITPTMMSDLRDRILHRILVQKKFKDKDYSAKKLAEDLGTNTRYISAVVNVCFEMNYTSFVNKFRVEAAMDMLADQRYKDMNMETLSGKVGFSNRQSFYASFYKFTGITPREYKLRSREGEQEVMPQATRKRSHAKVGK